MTITPHFLIGATLAATTASPLVAFLLGFFSHFVLDALPHFDPGTFHKNKIGENENWPAWIYLFILIEFIVTVTGFFLLFGQRPDFILICYGAIGGIAVDIIDNNPSRFLRKFPVFKQLHWFHEKIHFNLPHKLWFWGIPIQLIFIGGSIWFLLKF